MPSERGDYFPDFAFLYHFPDIRAAEDGLAIPYGLQDIDSKAIFIPQKTQKADIALSVTAKGVIIAYDKFIDADNSHQNFPDKLSGGDRGELLSKRDNNEVVDPRSVYEKFFFFRCIDQLQF